MRWRARRRAAALAAAVLSAVALSAVPPSAAAALPVWPGAVETAAQSRGLDAVALPVRPFGAPGGMSETVEGRVSLTAWRIEGDAAPLALARWFEERLAADGWETTLSCAAAACGGFDFRAGLVVLAPPAMRVSLFDYHQLTMRRGGETVALLTSRAGGAAFAQALHVAAAAEPGAPAARPDPPAPGPAPDPAAHSAPAPAPEDLGPDPAADLGAQLDRHGHALLDGVDFTMGEIAIAPGSEATLDAAAAALAARPGLSVAVVGHTDGVGPLDVNLRVSAARARAVAAALAERGVAARRLTPEGAGWLAPRDTNATEAGRARNRRVELVAR